MDNLIFFVLVWYEIHLHKNTFISKHMLIYNILYLL